MSKFLPPPQIQCVANAKWYLLTHLRKARISSSMVEEGSNSSPRSCIAPSLQKLWNELQLLIVAMASSSGIDTMWLKHIQGDFSGEKNIYIVI